jgi:hypothetical protein
VFRLAVETGLHHTVIGRIWRVAWGLYVDPPERAVVFSFDEKSQIQSLDRTRPGL